MKGDDLLFQSGSPRNQKRHLDTVAFRAERLQVSYFGAPETKEIRQGAC